MAEERILLTQYSHGAGCGCKIAPKVLEEILQGSASQFNAKLLVGSESKDDAAVYDMGNGIGLISTTDFFMPIVDDAFDFGRVAAANAISDVYAMGGQPIMALAILGWPVEKLPATLAQQVLEGGRAVCSAAGIPLAGGHSIDATEPIFGLAVTGTVPLENLKKNNTAKPGDWLLLTKPIGTGILSTAQKRGKLLPGHQQAFVQQLTTLNKAGTALGKIKGVHAMTDVTGFGLLGHLVEMCEGAGLQAELYYGKIPVLDGAKDYLKERIVPDATYRNWNSYSTLVGFDKGINVMEAFNLLPDPQTNGGLLVAVDDSALEEVREVIGADGVVIGRFLRNGEKGEREVSGAKEEKMILVKD
ncbi:MAG TPA: selenide, water dikinase SelD [Chitinophagaceae bacterium]|nr:selenide, water dikinase SelD [Chitinophagaceae bacterium]